METLGLGLILSFQDNASHHIHGVIGLLQHLRHSINDIGGISNIATAGLDRIARATGILGTSLSLLGGIATGVFTGMVADITKVGMEMEGMLTALDQMMGSKPKAMSRLLDFEQVAARTPLTFKDVANMGTQLTVVGLDPMKTYEGTWKAHRTRADGKTEGTYSRTLLEALGDLVAMRPDKGVGTAIREGKEFVEGQSRPLKMSYGLSTKEILGEKMADTTEGRADQLVRMLAAANILGGMEKAGENLHTIFTNLVSDVELFMSYMTLPEEAGAGGFIDYIKEPFKDLFEYMKNFTKQRDIMSTVGKSWANGFKIVVAPAKEIIRLLGELIKLALEFSLHHPKIVTFGIAVAGLASQIFLLGGAILVASALFNLFRARVLGGIAFSQFLRNSLVAARISMLAFARSVLPAVASLGLLYYAFRTNLFGIRSLVDSTFNYVSNFLSILFDAMTHYDLKTGLFSLSREHYDLAEEMGILDFVTAIVTAEGYVLRFWEGFKKGVSEAQAKLDAMTQKVVEFMEKMGILKKQDISNPSMAELQMTNEDKKPSKSYQQGIGTYENPIKNNVLYNMIVDKNFEEIGTKLGNIILPLTLFLTGIRAVTFAVGVLSPAIRALGTAFRFLGRFINIGSILSGLGTAFRALIAPMSGVLAMFGRFIGAGIARVFTGLLTVLSRPSIIMSGLATMLTRIGTALATLYTRFIGLFGVIGTRVMSIFSVIGARIGSFISSVMRYGAALRGIFRSAPNALTGIGRVLGNIATRFLTSIPIIGRFIATLIRIGRAREVITALRFALLSLRAVMAANPIGLALLAIGLAIEFVIAHWEQFEAAALSVWEHVTTTVSEAWERIKAAFEPALDAMKSAWDTFAEAFPEAAATIAGVLGGLIDIFSADADTASAIFTALGTVIKIAFDVVVFAIEAAASVISGIIQAIVGTFEGLINFIKAVFTADFSGALNAITGIVSSWGGAISTIVGGIASAFEGLVGRIRAAANEASNVSISVPATTSLPSPSAVQRHAYAEGGIIEKPEIALIGEAGREIIVPVTRQDERSKWLATIAAKETGAIDDILKDAQRKNTAVSFEVRGMEEEQPTAVLGATTKVIGGRSVYTDNPPTREELNDNPYLKFLGGNLERNAGKDNNPVTAYLPAVASVPTQQIPDNPVVGELMRLYGRQNMQQAGLPIVPPGGNVQAQEQRRAEDPLSFIAQERPQEVAQNTKGIISDIVPVVEATLDYNRNIALRNEEGTGYSLFRPEHFRDKEGLEVLIPTVVEIAKGIWKVVDKNEAIRHYMETGEHLGKFKTSNDAEVFAKALFAQKESMAYLRPDLNVVGTAPPRNYPSAENGSLPPVTPLGNVPAPVVPVQERMRGAQNHTQMEMTEMSGVPSHDNAYLEQMMNNRVQGNKAQVFTLQPPSKDRSNPPVLGNIFKGLDFFRGNIANVFGGLFPKKNEEKPPETAVLSTVERDKLPKSEEKTSNPVKEQIKPATYEGVMQLGKEQRKRPLTFIDKAAISAGNFVKRIFGVKQEEQKTSNPVTQNLEQGTNKPAEETSNPVIPTVVKGAQAKVSQPTNLMQNTAQRLRSIRAYAEDLKARMGIGEKTSNEEVKPAIVPNEEQAQETVINQQVKEAVPPTTFEGTNKATEKVEGIAPKEEKKKPNLWNKISSGWTHMRDSFLGMFGHKKEDNAETGSLSAPPVSGEASTETSSSGKTSNPVIPLQQQNPLAKGMPVQQSFSASVQLPQQQQPALGRGAQNNGGETFVFNEGAIKIEIKDAVDAKKLVPLIKKELERLKTTRQSK